MCYTGFMIVNNRGSSHFKVCVRCNWMEINLCTPVGLRILLLGTQLSLWHLFKQHRSVSSKYWKIFFLGPLSFLCTTLYFYEFLLHPSPHQAKILIVPYSPVRRRSKLESIEQSESNNNNNNNVDLHFFFKHYFILPERKGPFDLPKLINLHSTNLISW